MDLPASLRLLRRQPVLSQSFALAHLLFSSSFLLPLFTYFSLFRHLLFPLLVWRFCLFVCCCLHVWMRHSSLTSFEEFHTRDTLSPLHTYTPSSTTHGEFDRFAFFFFFSSLIYLPDHFSPGLSSIFLFILACLFPCNDLTTSFLPIYSLPRRHH